MSTPRRIENVNFTLPDCRLKIFPAPEELLRLTTIFDCEQDQTDLTQFSGTLYLDDQSYRPGSMLMLIETGQYFPDPELAQLEVLAQFNSPTNLFLCLSLIHI